jgi:hypothetical protein
LPETTKKKYPIGTIVYYGPDDKITTKIVASIFLAELAVPIKLSWSGDNVATNPKVINELGRFFKENGVSRVVMTGSNAGCPHQEGIDYPVGESCPHCPYWKDRQDQT